MLKSRSHHLGHQRLSPHSSREGFTVELLLRVCHRRWFPAACFAIKRRPDCRVTTAALKPCTNGMDGRCPLSRHLAGNELDISHFVQIRTSLVFLTLSVESIRSQAHSVGSPGTGDRLRLPPSRSVSQGTSRQV